MERIAEALPKLRHLLATPEELGGGWCLSQDVASVPFRVERSGSDRMGGSFRRWYLCPGEKRGPKVGKTKKGKGSKIMIVTDAQGLPLATHIDSASPAEVKLLETTLDKIAVGRKGSAGRPANVLTD
jgi:hypothetical protein